MITYLVVAIVGMAAMAVLGFLVGERNGDGGISKERQTILEERIGELTAETARQTDVIAQQTEDIKNEGDTWKANLIQKNDIYFAFEKNSNYKKQKMQHFTIKCYIIRKSMDKAIP